MTASSKKQLEILDINQNHGDKRSSILLSPKRENTKSPEQIKNRLTKIREKSIINLKTNENRFNQDEINDEGFNEDED